MYSCENFLLWLRVLRWRFASDPAGHAGRARHYCGCCIFDARKSLQALSRQYVTALALEQPQPLSARRRIDVDHQVETSPEIRNHLVGAIGTPNSGGGGVLDKLLNPSLLIIGWD